MVDLPEADRPVNQTVHPFCLRRVARSVRVRPECQVMLLWWGQYCLVQERNSTMQPVEV